MIGAVKLGRHHLIVSLDAGYHRAYSSGAPPVGLPFVGQTVGFQWQLGKRWALLPELGTAWSPTPNMSSSDSRLFHVGVAALFNR